MNTESEKLCLLLQASIHSLEASLRPDQEIIFYFEKITY